MFTDRSVSIVKARMRCEGANVREVNEGVWVMGEGGGRGRCLGSNVRVSVRGGVAD